MSNPHKMHLTRTEELNKEFGYNSECIRIYIFLKLIATFQLTLYHPN